MQGYTVCVEQLYEEHCAMQSPRAEKGRIGQGTCLWKAVSLSSSGIEAMMRLIASISACIVACTQACVFGSSPHQPNFVK